MRFLQGILAAALFGIMISASAQAAVLECDSCGSCNSWIAGASDGDIIQLNTSLTGVSGDCISFGGKDNLTLDCLGRTISGDGSGSGILLNDSEGGSFNLTVTGCIISSFYSGIQAISSSGNLFYNNFFNNTLNLDSASSQNWWNATLAPGTNIAGGPYMGGNFWSEPSGSGFSQGCTDSDGNMICDSAYVLDSGNADYLALTRDSTPPSIAFISPTPQNGTNVTGSYIEVNASLSEAGTCLLDWHNYTWTNVSMSVTGSFCYRNMSGLANGTYQFRVYANDSAGNLNTSEERQNGVSYSQPDFSPPVLIFVTPPNNTQTNQNWVLINVSGSESLGSCMLEWDGSNESLTPSGLSCYINKTSLAEGAHSFRMWASDSAGNWNSTETRYMTVNFSLQFISDYIAISYGISPLIVKTGTNTTVSFNVSTNGTLALIIARIAVPGSSEASFFFSANSTFNYAPSLTGAYGLTIFANTTRGYNLSVSGGFTGVDCLENEVMECGISIGECRKGNLTCQDGLWGTECEGAIGAQAEACNQKDDNCNGIIDEVAGGSSVQSTQCQCYGGQSPLVNELCNGIDDDCDGSIDENSDCCTNGQTRPCGTSLNTGACHPGTSSCSGGTWSQCSGAVFPIAEACSDLVDNDCDGLTDSLDTQDCKPFNLNQTINQTSQSNCGNGIMDGNEQGTDCGGDCPPCFDYTAIWVTMSVIGAAILGILLFMYFYLKRQGKELTWAELMKKWTPEKGYQYKAG